MSDIPIRQDGAPWRNFHGRRHGKKLRQTQAEHLETTLQDLRPRGVGWDENPDRAPLDLAALCGSRSALAAASTCWPRPRPSPRSA